MCSQTPSADTLQSTMSENFMTLCFTTFSRNGGPQPGICSLPRSTTSVSHIVPEDPSVTTPFLVIPVQLCLPPATTSATNATQEQTGQGNSYPDRPFLAQTVWFPNLLCLLLTPSLFPLPIFPVLLGQCNGRIRHSNPLKFTSGHGIWMDVSPRMGVLLGHARHSLL